MSKVNSLRFRISSIVLPLFIALAGMSAVLIFKSWSGWKQAEGIDKAVDMVSSASDLVHRLQRERGFTTMFLAKKKTAEELNKEVTLTEAAFKSLEAEVVAVTFLAPETRATLTNVRQSYDAIRKQIDQGAATVADVRTKFKDMINQLIDTQVTVSKIYRLDGIEARLISISILESAKEKMGRLRAGLNSVISANAPVSSEELNQYSDLKAGINADIHSKGLRIGETAVKGVNTVFDSEAWKFTNHAFESVVGKSKEGRFGVDPQEFFKNITQSIDDLREVMVKEEDEIESQGHERLRYYTREMTVILVGLALLFLLISGYTLRTLRSITFSLTTVSKELISGANTVTNASSQISENGTELSANATRQASALQETVASVEQVSAMVSKNADNAKRSLEVSTKSSDSAQQGQDAMKELLQAIDSIDKSNQDVMQQTEQSNTEIGKIVQLIVEIGNKTKIINDIVFQTKLLSFNASVEAARAGEHGKGFAVVAEEIGNLAQMSGNSAKEIATLLDTSLKNVEQIVSSNKQRVSELIKVATSKVEAGNERAKSCDAILSEIVSSSGEVATLVREIASASQEQSTGVREINTAMLQLDEGTQQNATSSRESAAASQSLALQANTLHSIVQRLQAVVQGGEIDESSVQAQTASPEPGANVVTLRKKQAGPPASPKAVRKPLAKAAGAEGYPSSEDSRFEDV